MTQHKALTQIRAARCLGNYASNSPEWHMLRANAIGGSMVSTICGLNKWESAYTAWAKFTGKIDSEIPDSPAMEWGRRLEAVVLDKFADNHPELEVIREVGTWQSETLPYQIANPDGIALAKDGTMSIIEIKTARFPDDWESGVPLYYLTQVQWYMSCLGLSKAYVAVLIGGSDYREYEVEADLFQQKADIELVEDFLRHCEHDIPPKWDGSESTYTSVRTMNPDIWDSEVELGAVGQDLQVALEVEAKAKEAAMKLKSQVMAMMGNAKRGLVDGQWAFSRQSRGSGQPFLVSKK